MRLSPSSGPLIEMGDIAAINFKDTVEVGEQKEGGRVINRTRGEVKSEASVTLYLSGYEKLLTALIAIAPVRGAQSLISLVQFTVNIQFTPPSGNGIAGQALGAAASALGVGGGIVERRLKGCRIMGDSLDAKEGTDAQQVEVPLSVLEIARVISGKELVML